MQRARRTNLLRRAEEKLENSSGKDAAGRGRDLAGLWQVIKGNFITPLQETGLSSEHREPTGERGRHTATLVIQNISVFFIISGKIRVSK